MNITIENAFIRVCVETFGAELKSIVDVATEIEYLWQGNPTIWPDTAPFLFPIVARQLDDKYTLNGKTYSIPMHGFAKDRNFQITDRSSESLTLLLTEDEETMQWYPFRFRLFTTFSLKEKCLSVRHTVKNLADQDMPFSIGEHPGFRVPLSDGEKLNDYFLEFSHYETAPRWYLNDEIIVGNEPGINGHVLPITEGLFNRGALIFKGLNSDSVTLRSHNHSHCVIIHLQGWQYLGIWSKPTANYVCIEPWNGLASSCNDNYDIWTKEGIRCLAPNCQESFILNITIH